MGHLRGQSGSVGRDDGPLVGMTRLGSETRWARREGRSVGAFRPQIIIHSVPTACDKERAWGSAASAGAARGRFHYQPNFARICPHPCTSSVPTGVTWRRDAQLYAAEKRELSRLCTDCMVLATVAFVLHRGLAFGTQLALAEAANLLSVAEPLSAALTAQERVERRHQITQDSGTPGGSPRAARRRTSFCGISSLCAGRVVGAHAVAARRAA